MKKFYLKIIICFGILTMFYFKLYGYEQYKFDKTEFLAKGKNECILNIGKPGRYLISIESEQKQGTSFKLVDKLTGVSESFGETGKTDGKGYFLLDYGEYKIITNSLKKGIGKFKISIIPTIEKNIQDEFIIKNSVKKTSLKDNEQLSYWIYIPESQIVYFECYGRNADDCKLWFEGEWLADSRIYKKQVLTETGQPLKHITMTAQLNAGYYLFTVYGGEKEIWANDEDKYPVCIKYGIRKIGNNMRFEDVISDAGENLYLCSAEATFFLIQIADKKKLKLEVSDFYSDKMFDFNNFAYKTQITKDSKEPECKIFVPNSNENFKIVRVSGLPEEKFILQVFTRCDNNEISLADKYNDGTYWLSTIHSGYPQDNIDATGIVIELGDGERSKIIGKSLIELNENSGWSRRFNLTGENSIFFEVMEAGEYSVKSEGIPAKCRIEPFLINKPEGYQSPEWNTTNRNFHLEKGIYVFSLKPEKKGIIKLAVSKQTLMTKIFKKLKIEDFAVKRNIQFVELVFNGTYSYKLFLNKQYRIDKGIVLKKYPVDINNPLPVVLRPDEQIEIKSLTFPDNVKLVISDSENIDCYIEGKKIENYSVLNDSQRGKILTLKNKGNGLKYFNLSVVSETEENQKLEKIISRLYELKKNKFDGFEKIKLNEQKFFDLDYDQFKTFEFNVEDAGIYYIESFGRLKLKAYIKTKMSNELYAVECNADNGNFIIHNFFKKGKYNIIVQAIGNTSGRTGIILKKGNIVEVDECLEIKEYGISVPSNTGLSAELNIDTNGFYYVESVGEKFFFENRIEDKNGWPVINVFKTPVIIELDQGIYKLISSPATAETYRLWKFFRYNIENNNIEGKGPHKILFGQKLKNIWIETEDINNRIPDKYEFNLPADAEITVKLTNYMRGVIKRKENMAVSGIIDKISGFKNVLRKGEYIIEVENSRLGNFLKYEIFLETTEIFDGITRTAELPSEFDLSIGEEGTYKIFSFGQTDVRAELFDEKNVRIAVSDDNGNNWNFMICKKLSSGKYKLKISRVISNENNSETENEYNVLPDRNFNDVWNVNQYGNYIVSDNRNYGKVSVMKIESDTLEKADYNFEYITEIYDKIKQFEFIASDDITCFKILSGKSLNFILENSEGMEIAAKTACDINLKILLVKGKKYKIKLWAFENISGKVSVKIDAVKIKKESELSENIGKPYKISGIESFLSNEVSSYLIKYLPSNGLELFYIDELEKPAEKITEIFTILNNKTVIIPEQNDSENNIEIQIDKFYLKEGKTQVSFYSGRPVVIDVPVETDFINSVKASSVSNKICAGIMIQEKEKNNEFNVKIQKLLISTNSSDFRNHENFTIFSKSGKLVLWNADNKISEELFINAELESNQIKKNNILLDIENNFNGICDTGAFMVFNGSYDKNIKFSIPRNCAVFSEKNGFIDEVFYNFCDKYENVSVKSFEKKIAVINLNRTQIYFTAVSEKFPDKIIINKFLTDSSGEIFNYNSRRIKLIFINSGTTTGKLNLTGNFEIISVLDASGKFLNDSAIIDLGKDISMNIKLNSGFFKFWISESENIFRRYGMVSITEEKLIPVSESREHIVKVKETGLLFKNDKPVFYKFYSAEPFVYKVSGTGYASKVCSEIFNSKLPVIFGSGEYKIFFKGFAENYINNIKIEKENIEIINDTYGVFTVINPGDIKCYSFNLLSEKIIGIGMESSDDFLECKLYDDKFNFINSGYHQINKLKAGDYYIEISLPHNMSYPVLFRPVIVGRFIPDNFEPAEYIKKYNLSNY
ncbi:hypothetical protein KA977_08055 [Candidatus Dependentiae bacterium]|nr:hypothetical protein [Candidatus Dependentiae bacterium]